MPAAEPPTSGPRPGLITRPALLAAGRPRWSLALWGVLLAVGIYAYAGALAREGFPPVNVPIAIGEATYFVDDPEVVDRDVAVPFQEAYADLDGVAEIRTFAQNNFFFGVVEFESSFSSADGLDALLAAPPPDVPAIVDLTFEPVDFTKFADTYDLIVTIAGPADTPAEELQAEADRIADLFAQVDEVEEAAPLNLFSEAIDPATGEPETRQTSFTRFARGGDTESVRSIGVGVVRTDGADADLLEFSDRIQSRIDDGLDLPDGWVALIGADFADDIRSQLSSLTSNLLFGLIAVAVVSLVLIGWRTAVLTAVFMGTVMLTALVGLWLIGYSLNTITLFGLILTLGLLVDDAIVISESIDASRDDPEAAGSELGIIRRAVDRVGAASFAGTLSTLTVFAPMAFVGGVLGEFIRPIPITVIITLALSFLLSVTLIPVLGRVFILRGGESRSPVVRGQRRLAAALGRLAAYPAGKGWRGWLAGAGVGMIALVFVVMSFGTAARVGFNIFPPTKDSNGMQISVDFDTGTSVAEAQELQAEIDRIVLATLGEDATLYQVVFGTERSSFAIIDLVPMDGRSVTSPGYVDRVEAATADMAGARISANPVDIGPPPDEFPFQVQVLFAPEDLDAAQALASDVAATLPGQELDKSTGDTTHFVTAFVATDGQVRRTDGERILEVRANFDNDDTSANLAAAEDLVASLWPADDLEARGLSADALSFDFGFESDNQDDFASLVVALLFAIVLMLAFLVIQFRSAIQPVLVFLAVPFSFFGVFTLLERTDNPLSFFVMVGFIALVGVAVNNTILLVDAANQARRAGASRAEAIGQAIEMRFRPLVVTTATTVAGLLPLALSDPFWEALCFVLIGGLVSSTVLVLVSFPPLYLAVETSRDAVRLRWRRLRRSSRRPRPASR
ncbi:MAG: efflux RND transporter permease subunit [Acidimicrobiales bacterium]|nr:efflux RND transporter permease subunit [Acidimicrobiales bacterium]